MSSKRREPSATGTLPSATQREARHSRPRGQPLAPAQGICRAEQPVIAPVIASATATQSDRYGDLYTSKSYRIVVAFALRSP
jgi:hypothetical protein